MMRRYDSYKDSGVEWIGEIPSHWKTIKTYLITENLDGKRIPLNSEQRGEMGGDIPYWGSGGIVDYINEFIFDEELLLVGEDGSPFFDPFRDVSFYVNEKIWVNNHIHILKTKKEVNTNFLVKSFNCVDYKEYITGSTRDKLTQSDLDRIIHPIPPISEQQQIVSYLDTKTSLIDSLIEKTKLKIQLLKENRTSLINEVVTKGLNPNVEMRDSGVEWIGEIPSHWNLVKLKQLFFINKRISGELGYDVLSVTQRGLKVKDLENNEGQHSMDYSKYQLVFEGDFVMNHMDLLTGFVDLSNQVGVTSPDYRVFTKTKSDVVNNYFLYIFQLCYSRRVFYGLGRGVSNLGRWRLPSTEFLDFYLTYPSFTEQQQIVSYLDEHTQLIDKTISVEERRIDTLKEYRQSLISEVVTGKRKVVD
jgi:type I restriction enzyme S subunit